MLSRPNFDRREIPIVPGLSTQCPEVTPVPRLYGRSVDLGVAQPSLSPLAVPIALLGIKRGLAARKHQPSNTLRYSRSYFRGGEIPIQQIIAILLSDIDVWIRLLMGSVFELPQGPLTCTFIPLLGTWVRGNIGSASLARSLNASSLHL